MPIQNSIERSTQVLVYTDGVVKAYRRGTDVFSKIEKTWNEMTREAFPMPAFGVSIDSLTREEMKEGIWVEFLFEKETECDGMPFERLLVAVKPDYHGFNLIRFTSGGYNGRCFYLDLREKTMQNFYSMLETV